MVGWFHLSNSQIWHLEISKFVFAYLEGFQIVQEVRWLISQKLEKRCKYIVLLIWRLARKDIRRHSRLYPLNSIRLSRSSLSICKNGAETSLETQIDQRKHHWFVYFVILIRWAERVIDQMRLLLDTWLLPETKLRLEEIKMRVNGMHDIKMTMVKLMLKKRPSTYADAYVSSFENSLFLIDLDLYLLHLVPIFFHFPLKPFFLVNKWL